MSLTPREKEIIIGTWAMVAKDMQASGLALFKQFFSDNPTYQSYFSFRNVEGWDALSQDKRLKAHAANVMYTLSMMIDNLSDTDVFVEMVEKLASNHIRRKLNVSHFENLKGSLVRTLVGALGESVMNEEAIAAWAKAYSVITSIIQKHVDAQ